MNQGNTEHRLSRLLYHGVELHYSGSQLCPEIRLRFLDCHPRAGHQVSSWTGPRCLPEATVFAGGARVRGVSSLDSTQLT